jgi:hypothetical protein
MTEPLAYRSAPAWWKDFAERALRNEVQALLPLLAVAVTAGATTNWTTLAASAGYVAVWTLIKQTAFLTFDVRPEGWVDVLARVASAVAASVLASVPEHFWNYDHWDRAAISVVGAAATSLLMIYGMPPTQGVKSADDIVHG